MEPTNRFAKCLLEQKNEENRQARRLRRRTVLISILIQLVVLSLLMLRPLFGAPAPELMIARLLPRPPWKGSPGAHEPPRPCPPILPPQTHVDVWLPPVHFPSPHSPEDRTSLESAPEIGSAGDGPASPGFGDPNGLLPIPGSWFGAGPLPPIPPREPDTPPRKPKPAVVPPEVQEALLLTRIEPQYPVLAKQIHLEGTVVIRAVIAKDGTVQSVEILSGHPLFVREARDAILQWRYRPTLLRGEPIEVETLITVIFKMH